MAQAPMRADEAITSTRPNAIRFPRRSRETVQAVQSRYRLKPTRLGPQDGPGRIFLTRPVS